MRRFCPPSNLITEREKMAIDNETVKRIAFLSRLKIDEDKIDNAKIEFNNILNWIEQLNEVNTDNVEPLEAVNEFNLPLREDKIMLPQEIKERLSSLMLLMPNMAILSFQKLSNNQNL